MTRFGISLVNSCRMRFSVLTGYRWLSRERTNTIGKTGCPYRKFHPQDIRHGRQSRSRLQVEILALRQQLIVLRRTAPKRVRLRAVDRLLFVRLYRLWPGVSGFDRCYPARHRRALAPRWLQSLMVVEISTPSGETRHS
jgi:hypothetical protein